ncbi:MAG: nuclear transport factor 2 family protein [Pyrinomonadaceae bacterium]|nr:nuclear transport factor 2 family protein [Pyrinomonadaceae bacterium]
MIKKFSFTLVLLLFVFASGLIFLTGRVASADAPQQSIAAQIIARERAAFDAWQKKDKAFWADYLAEDATAFFSQSPYLETEPKVNFLPKFEQYTEMMKTLDFQMYNPRVQTYGDTAILTYNASSTVNFAGRTMSYTSKVTTVYAKQGNTWRVVHTHESMNPGAQ